MNYISAINSFWDSATTNPLSTGQVSLYFALLHINNRSNWIEWFSASNQVLSVLTGLSKSGILKARNELKQRGLLEFKERGTKATLYRITMVNSTRDSVQDSTQDSVRDGARNSTRNGVRNSNPLKEIEENKQNIEKSSTDVLPEKETFSSQLALICELYNSICGSYPRLNKLSEARKKAIHARLNTGYTVDDFKKLFEYAESSSFLKGKNNRNWSATFDWLIKDANMVKVLEGKYQDKEEGGEKDASGGSTEDYYRQLLEGCNG